MELNKTLGNYVKVQGGFAYKSGDFKKTGIPVIKIKNVGTGRLLFDEYSCVDEELAEETKTYLTNPGDVLISMTGSGPNQPGSLVGRVAKVTERDPQAVINQRVGRLVLKKANTIDLRYLYYLLSTKRSQEYLVANSTGSANQANISGKTIEAIPIPNVTFNDSVRIADILESLDNKIDLNHRNSQVLDQIAQTFFKSWFVDFDPVKTKIRAKEDGLDPELATVCSISGKSDEELGQLTPEQRQRLATTAALFPDELETLELGEIPKGWGVKPLDQIATFLNGLALQKFPPVNDYEWLPVIKISQLKKGDASGADHASLKVPAQYIINDGDVLFSWSGSLEVDIWCGGKGALNQHLFKVMSEYYPKWFYFYWTKYHLANFQAIAAGKAVTMGHIQRKHITEALCVVPAKVTMQALNTIMRPLFERQIENRKESRTLTALRDTLLPKLLSGELELDAVQ
jgi:type I restriction enzyme S subunit